MFVEENAALIFIGFYFLANFCGDKFNQPILKIVAHWLRWLSFALCFSHLLVFFEWSSRPDWVHFITGLALWFVAETVFYRISVQLFNLSEIQLFPKYQTDTSDNLWPISREADSVKETLTKQKFKKIEVIKADLLPDLKIRQALFLDEARTIRVDILFVPNTQKEVTCFFSLSSLSDTNDCLITDNQNMPFGGFYPKNWSVTRHPIQRSLSKLLELHREKMRKKNLNWSSQEERFLTKVNANQRLLERENQAMGFLVDPEHQRNQKHGRKGKISSEGCIRICIEMWLLSYFGKTLKL